MKIKSVHIKNFRSIKNVKINFENYTTLIGANGAGKSNILRALNLFFNEISPASLTIADWHNEKDKNPIEISITFSELTAEEINIFKHYYASKKVIVTLKILSLTKYIYVGSRHVLEDFKKFFELSKVQSTPISTLRSEYRKFQILHPNLLTQDTKVKRKEMEEAIRNYENTLPLRSKKIIRSEDTFYGKQGKGKLDPFIKWIYVPASKDITLEAEEQKSSYFNELFDHANSKTAFADRVEKAIRRTSRLIKGISEKQTDLDDISTRMTESLRHWTHGDVSVHLERKPEDLPEKLPKIFSKISENGFSANIEHFGHGLHRSYLFALLQTLAEKNRNELPDRIVILGIEEPEIYQHPQQIRILSKILGDLSKDGKKFQIVTATHSPLLIQSDKPETIKRIQKISKATTCSEFSLHKARTIGLPKDVSKISQDLYRILNEDTAEMYFSDKVVLVEGKEDIAYIRTYWELEKQAPFPMSLIKVDGKKNFEKPILFARIFGIKTYVVFDNDKRKNIPTNQQAIVDDEKTRRKIMRGLNLADTSNPAVDFIGDDYTIWSTFMNEPIGKEMPNLNLTVNDKEPLKIAEELTRCYKNGERSASLKTLSDKIEAFTK